jgi:hypothetical protein
VRVRVAIAIGLVLIGAGLALTLFKSEEPFVGDNGREVELPAGVVIPPGAQACQPEIGIPRGAGTIRMTVGTAGKPAGPLAVTISQGRRTLGSGATRGGIVDEPVRAHVGAGIGGARHARVCVSNRGPNQVALWGQEVPFGQGARVSARRMPQTRAMRLEWFEPHSATRISRAGVIAHRYGLVKASWVGTWTFWVALAVLVAVSAAGVALVARETLRASEA